MTDSPANPTAADASLSAFVVRECREIGAPQEAVWILDHLKEKALESGDELESPAIYSLARSFVERRRGGEPLAYVLGAWAFREYEFGVGPGVLIPRPETEELVEIAIYRALPLFLSASADKPFVVYDLGSGSGCIGLGFAYDLLKLALKQKNLESLPRLEIHLVERSVEAQGFLQKNVDKFLSDSHLQKHLRISSTDFLKHVSISVEGCDWNQSLEAIVNGGASKADVVLSNPPYLSEKEWAEVEPSVRSFEPQSALVPDRDTERALQPYFELIDWAERAVQPHAFVLAELGFAQVEAMEQIDQKADTLVKTLSKDMNGKLRFVAFHPKFTEQNSEIGKIKDAAPAKAKRFVS